MRRALAVVAAAMLGTVTAGPAAAAVPRATQAGADTAATTRHAAPAGADTASTARHAAPASADIADTAAAAATHAAPAPTASPTPTPTASPRPGRFVEVNPSTAEEGSVVGIRASCPDNSRPAHVESRVFDGEIEVRPQFGFLTAAAPIRTDLNAQSYRIVLDCPDTLLGASTTLEVVTDNRPPRGPATGFGGLAGEDGSLLPTGQDGGSLLLTGGAVALAAGLALALLTFRRHHAARLPRPPIRAGAAPRRRPPA